MDELPIQLHQNQNEELLSSQDNCAINSIDNASSITESNIQSLPEVNTIIKENPSTTINNPINLPNTQLNETEDDKNSDNDPAENETNTQAINEMLAQLQTEQEDPTKSDSTRLVNPTRVKQDPLSENLPQKKEIKKLLTTFNTELPVDEVEGTTITYTSNKDVQYMSINLIASKLLQGALSSSSTYINISKRNFITYLSYQKPCLLSDDAFFDVLSYVYVNIDKQSALQLLNEYVVNHFKGELQGNTALLNRVCEFYKRNDVNERIKFYNHELTIGELVSTIQDKDDIRTYTLFMEWSGQKVYATNDSDKEQVELPLDKSTSYFEITKWSSHEIAKQLTLITCHLFRNINAKEVLNCLWTKADKMKTSPNITKLINRFNQISCWMSDEILSYDHASQRGKIIAKFIEIADELQKMKNYNDCFNIVTAFNYLPIKRLTKSWNRVGETALETLKKLSNLCSLTRNWGNLREEYKKYKEIKETSDKIGCIPYVGYFLKELAFIDEGPKYFNDNDLICVEKIVKVGKVIDELKYFQKMGYNYQPAFALSFLAEPKPQDEDKLLALSKKLEPKFILLKSKTMKKRITETDQKYGYFNIGGNAFSNVLSSNVINNNNSNSGSGGNKNNQSVFNGVFKSFLKENANVNSKVMTLRERLQLRNLLI